jgi:hypothetical protein
MTHFLPEDIDRLADHATKIFGAQGIDIVRQDKPCGCVGLHLLHGKNTLAVFMFLCPPPADEEQYVKAA